MYEEWIIEGLKASGKTRAGLAGAMGVSPPAVSQMLNGKRAIKAHELPAIARYLELPLPSDDAPASDVSLVGVRLPAEPMGERNLPVFSAAEGGQGSMVIYTDPIDFKPRPWFFAHVAEAFAVIVTGDSMYPVYEPGDMVLVNPRLPCIRGKDAIFVGGERTGEFQASIKRYLGVTETHWLARQFNPPDDQERDFQLARKEWGKALRVVGRYTG